MEQENNQQDWATFTTENNIENILAAMFLNFLMINWVRQNFSYIKDTQLNTGKVKTYDSVKGTSTEANIHIMSKMGSNYPEFKMFYTLSW